MLWCNMSPLLLNRHGGFECFVLIYSWRGRVSTLNLELISQRAVVQRFMSVGVGRCTGNLCASECPAEAVSIDLLIVFPSHITMSERCITILCIRTMFNERRFARLYPTLTNSAIKALSPRQMGPRRNSGWNAKLILKKRTSSQTFLYQVWFVAKVAYAL